MDLEKELRELYLKTSKHSNYQMLNEELKEVVRLQESDVHSRYEEERFKYITDNIDLKGKKLLDIGGNTGYFTFESLKSGCDLIDYYEGNNAHADFVKKARELFADGDKVNVIPEYYMFDSIEKKYDVVYCLNVVHHLGDDFMKTGDVEKAKEKMLDCINKLSYITEYLVLQVGFNWCGNRFKCLFENGTKKEMEQFIENGVSDNWNIIKIAVAERKDDKIVYNDLTENNNVRDDSLGEFLNRPLFVMRRKK